MMNLSKALALASLLLVGATSLKAQTNLILNPSFEDVHPWNASNRWQYVADHWATPMGLSGQLVADGHTGKALKVEPSDSQTFRIAKLAPNEDGLNANLYYIAVTPGSEYTLSYWYKGTEGSYTRFYPTLTWMKTDDSTEEKDLDDYQITIDKTNWQQQSIVFTAPEGVKSLGISFNLSWPMGDASYFDDFSLIESRPATPPAPAKPDAPTGVAEKAFQREVELSWANAEGTTWQVTVEGTDITKEVTTNSVVLEGLEPGQTYNVQIRSKANEVYSDATEKSITTQALEKEATSADRVPYLRTITEEGVCSKVLLLYYNDLAEANATITYKIDDLPAVADGKQLTFDKLGKQKLSIHIEESSDRAWDLEYNVDVK